MADTAKRLERAEKYLQKGRMDAALQEYLELLQEEPGNDSVRQTAADLCLTLGRSSDAATLLSQLLDHSLASGQGTKAGAVYKKLARVATPTAEQSLHCAQVFEKTSKKDALDAYNVALRAFSDANRTADALLALDGIVALEPTVERLRQQGEMASRLGHTAKAVGSFLRAAELNKQNPESDGGLALYECAYKLDSGSVEARLAYGQSLLARYETSKSEQDAHSGLEILKPLISGAEPNAGARAAYGNALLLLGRAVEAQPFIWELFEKDPERVHQVAAVIGGLLDQEKISEALELARKLEKQQQRAGRRREYVVLIQGVAEKHPPHVEFLEYLVEVFNSCNREQDYCTALIKLFDLYYAAGNFVKAGDCLDRAAEVDAYEPGHANRLEMLRGKIDPNSFRAIAGRFGSVLPAGEGDEKAAKPEPENETTVLEDLMLQAEIFLQYSMRSKAAERLQRIQKLFPNEELRNEKLRNLYMNAGITPAQAPLPAATAAVAAPAPPGGVPPVAAAPPPSPAPPPLARAVADENAVDNISRVTEITRNIYRQGNVKSVLFTGVNEAGRHWNASRCIAVLCTPGKPPSIALEYCAPGMTQSDVMAIVKLIGIVQPLCVSMGPISVSFNGTPPQLIPLKQFAMSMGIHSMLAVPLVEGEEQAGLLVLAQCDGPRDWRPTDVVVLKTIADQIVLAVANARLRSLVKNLAVTEEKSGLLKRSSYLDVLLSEVRRAVQQNSTATVMLLHFGKASELVKQSSEAGVEGMVQQIGQLICSHIRQSDLAIRYDLTSIALVLADTSDKNAFFALDKLRKVLVNSHLPGGGPPVVTAGIAEAVMRADFDPVDIVTEVINRAEAALDMALREGGNKAQSLAPTLEAAAAEV